MKKAFTLLELIFVIVVIGILAATIIPRTNDDSLARAATQLQSHIRYTQHLAMIDDKFDPADGIWYKKRWQIIFTKSANSDNKWAYTIFSDTSGKSKGKPNESEIAWNPLHNNQRMTGGYNSAQDLNITNDEKFIGMKNLNLGLRYGIRDMSFSCNQRISFDYLGRPIKSDLSSNYRSYDSNDLIRDYCDINLSNGRETATVRVYAETGYVQVIY